MGLEPIQVTRLTCEDAKTTDTTSCFHPAGSLSIRLDRELFGVRRTGFSPMGRAEEAQGNHTLCRYRIL
ncbi:hypothetical protein [Streptomyces sp. NPDC058632]|uniref:hypothetical protein n=1 Tax=Streptomyces sp. NPDC058632 TaxID=3346567 RepID=UPI0036513E15